MQTPSYMAIKNDSWKYLHFKTSMQIRWAIFFPISHMDLQTKRMKKSHLSAFP